MAGSNTKRKRTGVSITSLNKRSVGRPSVITPETLSKLEQAFAIGASDVEACFYADINPESLYSYQRKNPTYTERKDALKQRPILAARQKIVDDIGKDVATAKWYLERKMKNEFSTKVEQDTNITVVQPILSGMAKQADQKVIDDIQG